MKCEFCGINEVDAIVRYQRRTIDDSGPSEWRDEDTDFLCELCCARLEMIETQ